MSRFPTHSPAQLGAVLRGFRLQRGLSQVALAGRLGLPQKAISLAETHPERMGLKRLFALLAALELELVVQDGAAHPRPKAEW